MNDKKLPDSEILRALECCISDKPCIETGCPLHNDDMCGADTQILEKYALDLINRLQAENERLRAVKKHIDILIHRGIEYPTAESYNEAFQKALARLYDNTKAKAEAYKEFAERLNKEAEKVVLDREGDFVEIDDKLYATVADWCKAISDNLLKELVGDSK